MKPQSVATFFESFRKDRQLFLDLIRFYDGDNRGRITHEPKETLDQTLLLELFDAIVAYSPKDWIASQKQPPRGEVIAQHVHNHNIHLVKHYFKK
jgi:hypothetical protein